MKKAINKETGETVEVIRVITQDELRRTFESGQSDIPYWYGDYAEVSPMTKITVKFVDLGFVTFIPAHKLDFAG